MDTHRKQCLQCFLKDLDEFIPDKGKARVAFERYLHSRENQDSRVQEVKAEEDGASSSETTFRFVINNFSRLRKTVLSPPTIIHNLQWRIMVMQRMTRGKDNLPTKSLGFFLQCNGGSESSTWSCNAKAELKVISQKEGIANYSGKLQHLFTSKEKDFGFRQFLFWNDVLDPEKGYIKGDSVILEVNVTIDAPPAERHQETLQRKKKANLYMIVQIVTSDNFCGHQGTDLFDPDKVKSRNFRVKKMSTLQDLMELISKQMKYPLEMMRIWPLIYRTNQTCRPVAIDFELDPSKHIIDIADSANPWTIFLETIEPDSGIRRLQEFDRDSDILLFFKLYDPKSKQMSYCGHTYIAIHSRASNLLPLLNERAGFPAGTKLMLFEEVEPNVIERIENIDQPLEKVLDEASDGDIIVFQRADSNFSNYELPTAKDYFTYLCNRIDVTFCDITAPDDSGFTIQLSLKMNYYQMAKAVSQRLNTNPFLLQFFTTPKDWSGTALKSAEEEMLKDLLAPIIARKQKKIYYKKLEIKVDELENKKKFKCIWVNSKLKEEKKLVLNLCKSGVVADLLEEAKKQVELSENGSGRLRLLEIVNHKIFTAQREELPLDLLAKYKAELWRIEEIPKEEVEIADDELLVPVAHFQKVASNTFGVPFFLKIKQKEPFHKVKERIKKRLGVSDKEFKNYKFAIIVMGRQQLIKDELDYHISLPDFLPYTHQQSRAMQPRPWLGVDHLNKAAKCLRSDCLEK